MKKDTKAKFCVSSYWILFIILPLAFILFANTDKPRIGLALGGFILLVLIGEHALRNWKKLWNLE